MSVSVDPSGTAVATASADNSIRVWDARTGKLFGVVKGKPLLGALAAFVQSAGTTNNASSVANQAQAVLQILTQQGGKYSKKVIGELKRQLGIETPQSVLEAQRKRVVVARDAARRKIVECLKTGESLASKACKKAIKLARKPPSTVPPSNARPYIKPGLPDDVADRGWNDVLDLFDKERKMLGAVKTGPDAAERKRITKILELRTQLQTAKAGAEASKQQGLDEEKNLQALQQVQAETQERNAKALQETRKRMSQLPNEDMSSNFTSRIARDAERTKWWSQATALQAQIQSRKLRSQRARDKLRELEVTESTAMGRAVASASQNSSDVVMQALSDSDNSEPSAPAELKLPDDKRIRSSDRDLYFSALSAVPPPPPPVIARPPLVVQPVYMTSAIVGPLTAEDVEVRKPRTLHELMMDQELDHLLHLEPQKVPPSTRELSLIGNETCQLLQHLCPSIPAQVEVDNLSIACRVLKAFHELGKCLHM